MILTLLVTFLLFSIYIFSRVLDKISLLSEFSGSDVDSLFCFFLHFPQVPDLTLPSALTCCLEIELCPTSKADSRTDSTVKVLT